MNHDLCRLLPPILILLLLSGCANFPVPGSRLTIGGLPAASVDPVGVDISNAGGSVTLEVDPKVGFPTVTVSTDDRHFKADDQPWLAAEYEQAEPRPVLRILSAAPLNGDSAGVRPVHLHVVVPGCAGLRIRNAGGPVFVRGVTGAVDIQNGSPVASGGEVEVIFAEPLDAPVLISTATGPIRVDVPQSSRALLRVESGVGAIVLEAPRETITGAKGDKFVYQCDLNGGEHEVRLIAGEGPVRLRVLSKSALRSERPTIPVGWQ